MFFQNEVECSQNSGRKGVADEIDASNVNEKGDPLMGNPSVDVSNEEQNTLLEMNSVGIWKIFFGTRNRKNRIPFDFATFLLKEQEDLEYSTSGSSETDDDSESQSDQLNVNESKPYACAECEGRFTYLHHLEQHITTHFGQDFIKPKRHMNSHKNSSTATAADPSNMLKHKKNVHKKPRRKTGSKFVCEICSKKFETKPYLERHMYSHASGQPFVCDRCDQRFKHRSSLKRHKRKQHQLYD